MKEWHPDQDLFKSGRRYESSEFARINHELADQELLINTPGMILKNLENYLLIANTPVQCTHKQSNMQSNAICIRIKENK